MRLIANWNEAASRVVGRRDFNRMLAASGLAVVAFPLLSRNGSAAEEIEYFTWSGYEIPELHPGYFEKYGGSPKIALFGEEEEALQKIRAGATPDVVHPCSENIGRWRDAGVLKPIDVSRLSHWPDIWERLKAIEGTVTADGQHWFVPIEWGNSSALYRTDLVELEEESWSLMFDERYKGRIGMRDLADSAIQIAAMVLGYDNLFSLDDAQLEKIGELLRRQRALVPFYWSDVTTIENGLASGELVVAYAWNSSAVKLTDQGVPVKYMTPKEGRFTWVCGLVLAAEGAGDEAAAYDFIDAMLSPEAGRYFIEEFGYGHSSEKAFDSASRETLDKLGLSTPTEMFNTTVFQRPVPAAYEQKYIQLWEAIKTGQ